MTASRLAHQLSWTPARHPHKQVACHYDEDDILALDALAHRTQVTRSDALRVALKRLLVDEMLAPVSDDPTDGHGNNLMAQHT